MDKAYDPKLVEDAIYASWEKARAFAPRQARGKHPYTIIMPPPNANDPLHIGHAMFITLEDILTRYHRMKGDETEWLPGADHAGIETQFVFEKKLKKEGKSRFDFDRETLFTMIWDYVQANKDTAVNQMKKLGASADWEKFTFTLDPDIVAIVLGTFTKLHEDKLLYRDMRLVNYCTRCGTGFSELEAKHEEKIDPFVTIKYGDFTIGTVRPETKFRDTALAVNPADKRYKKFIGKTFDIMGLLGPISMTIIPDPEVDPEFGTGMMKVTPAHDFHDFELGKVHNLPVTPIIDLKGKMDFSWYLNDPNFPNFPKKYQDRARKYHGLHVSKARPLMIEHMKDDGLLVSIDENYKHTVATCYRCGSTLEPLPLPQFFIKVEPLVKPVLKALKDKKVKIHGAGYDKILTHWLTNLKDWNISRQIVWGIRMPVWYDVNANPTIHISFVDTAGTLQSGRLGDLLKTHSLTEVKSGLQSLQAPMEAAYVISASEPSTNHIQETDTFDTWFSSAQWPFATLQARGLFDRFYPTNVMETAYDILIFWVMRMLMMGMYATGKVPFRDVYLHGLVRDEKGQKMSKSKGNVINPLDIVERFGADTLRMALVMSTTPGQDSAVGESKVKGMRNFANKVWNAARFVQMQQNNESNKTTTQQSDKDEEFRKKLSVVTTEVTSHLESLRIGLAAETVHNEFWHWFCDIAIEQGKAGELSIETLEEGLETFLKLLHPFMPFVTEHIWAQLGKTQESLLITSPWPVVDR